jgi:SAM-dependent methyltransferase
VAFEALQSKEQYLEARQKMQERDIDCADRLSFVEGLLERYGKLNRVKLGDVRKSWDVLKTVQFIEQRLAKSDAVLDIGAYGSEILIVLHKLGYNNLTGIDLNPKLHKMPDGDIIRYVTGNFMNTSFENGSFAAITSISVIEHGFNGEGLLREMARLLRPGGYFIASFDFWPTKIDTSNLDAFGMDWMIFSRDDVHRMIKTAEQFGLQPVQELNFAVGEPPIKWNGKQYTFGWLALQKAE